MCCVCDHSSLTPAVIHRGVYCNRCDLETAEFTLNLYRSGLYDKSATFFRQKLGFAISQEGGARV